MDELKKKVEKLLKNVKKEKIISKKPKIKKPRTSKCSWVEVGGKKFYARSSWEANYGRYLQWLKDRGEILDWEHEPQRFTFDKIKRGNNSYLPDFKVYKTDGSHEWHETKGFNDSVSKTKIKRFKFYYPEEKLVLIDSTIYNQIKNNLSRMIPGWGS